MYYLTLELIFPLPKLNVINQTWTVFVWNFCELKSSSKMDVIKLTYLSDDDLQICPTSCDIFKNVYVRKLLQ